MQNFAAELRRLSKECSLAELAGKDFYREYCHTCKFRKSKKWDGDERWTVCTHPSFDDSAYTWACMIHYCPFVSEGIKEAYTLWNKKKKEKST